MDTDVVGDVEIEVEVELALVLGLVIMVEDTEVVVDPVELGDVEMEEVELEVVDEIVEIEVVETVEAVDTAVVVVEAVVVPLPEVVMMGCEGAEKVPEVPIAALTTPESPGLLLGWKEVVETPLESVEPDAGVKLYVAVEGV